MEFSLMETDKEKITEML